ncbi:amino acid adenylation domain-containing protein [Archangium violaceum]|uniref:amino acid adenylation domain-containing protein n=1 Tax=Archangium violaceum TaxID=83451 RepID=UPI00069832CB|nr:non-ribosomal peptide synthetase [Archangium violaceum]
MPLSSSQQRLWFIEQLAPGGFTYNVPLAARLKGRLDVAALERSLEALVRRHEALRTTFTLEDGQPVQRIAPEAELTLPVESLEALAEEERAGAVPRLVEEEARRPFELEKGPLFRARLLRLAADEHVLLLSLHHIVCDGWSLEVMERELTALYGAYSRGETPRLPALPVQYPDYAVWQREGLKGEALEARLAWWKQRLAGAPPVLELPTDRPRPVVRSSRGAVLRVALSPELSATVRERSRLEGVTPFMTLLAGFQALLSRYSGQPDVVVGTPVSGRNRRELEGLIGFFANTLPLRVEAPGGLGFRELLKRVRESCLGALSHQEVPFEQMVNAVQPVRDSSRTPLFQASFALQGAAPFAALELPGVTVEELVFEPGVAKTDLTLYLRETPRGLVGLWEYSTALFDEATVARMAAHYARLLEGGLAEPERALAELPMLSEAERHQMLVEWNPVRTESPRPATVHGLFEEHAARQPEAEAVEYEGERLTYAELNRRANQVARNLRRLGVGEGTRVGLCAERSLELVAAMLGILKAGGAYVPLDPSYPAERLAFMVEDTAVPVVLAQPEFLSRWEALGATVVPLERSWETFAHEGGENLGETGGPEALAYVMYTSGSTGRPKGVCIPHRGIVRLVRDTVHVWLTQEDRFAQVCNTSFDASTLEVWGALVNGGCLVGVPREVALSPRSLAAFLREKRISATVLPTALFHQVVAECPDAFHTLKYVVAGGESPDPNAMRKVLERGAPRYLLNGYGPTENTTASTFFVVGNVPEGAVSVPIGTPPANAEAYVLDERMQPVPVGVAGELYVGGEGLALGYLNRPELTAERFVAHPFSPMPGARLYKTGDLARYLRDGNLEFLGRRDEQVKVRGFRVELGEIETALAKHPEVSEAVVVARDDGASGKQLVAYVVPNSPLPSGEGRGEGATGPGLNPEELRTWLKQTLPVHMVPSAFVRLEAFPLTPNGKVDRKSLPAPELEGVGAEYVPPRTALEELVAELWASLLGVRRVGAHDHFFELGGHSLLATRLVSRLREVLRIELPVSALFEAPTVAELARRLESVAEPSRGPRPPPLVPQPEGGTLPLSFAQQGLWFIEQLAPGGFTYNVPYVTRLRGRLEVPALERSLGALIQRHEALRTTFTQVEGQPVQRIAPALAFALPVENLEGVPRRVEEEFRRPFELERGPLFRALLLRVAAEEHVLVLVMHHIVCDGWSLNVLARELAALYQAFSTGSTPSLPELPVRYGDYTRWQREWLKGESLESLLGWWRQRLAGVPPVLELPTDRPRPPVQTFRGAMIPMRLPVALSRALGELSRREGVTPFMTLLAGFQALLARYSGQQDFVVGSPSAGRTHRELEGLIGLFINTLALRAEVPGTASFRTLLGRVREACLGAYAHQELPVEQLIHTLQPVRDPSRAQLFQVVFSQIEPAPALPLPGVVSEEVAIETGLAKFDLNLFVRETEEGWESLWEYNTGLYDEATVARMAAHYVRLLEGAVARPEQEVFALPLLGEEERRRLLVEWNQTRTEYPRHASVHGLFEEQVARRPEAVAVEDEGQRLTYAELNVRANQVARTLRGLGVGAGTPVGLCVGRSLELVVATLGILKAGGAYVPLDPSYPPERLAFMLEDTAVPVVLAQPELASELPAGGAFVLELSREAFAHESGENLEETVGPESLAYVMYTSGSTGRPKGVCIPHRGIVRLVRDTNYVRFTEEDRVAQVSNTSFDASTLELWGALLNGGCLVGVPREVTLAPKALAAFLREQRVSAMFLTTSLFNQVAAECPEAFRTVRQVLFGGEAADPRWVRAVLEQGTAGTLVNGYGPTEMTTFTCCYVLTEPGQVRNPMPIGRPISNTVVYVLDERMQPVPVGVAGELYAGGDGLALGYLNRPELTAERFVPHPFSEDPRARLYKTGDRVRYLADGRLEYLGRGDAQVKVRGFRIELGEVEAALAKHPGVGEVVVVVRNDGPSGKHLVAYVVPISPRPPGEGRGEGATGPGFKSEELRTWLKQTLPEYMVPSAFVRLERLPLTPNGKLDRAALPAPEADGTEREEYVAPRTRMEQLVADIWAPLLKQPRVGARDDFFELGGHSLLAAQVATRLREALQREFPILMLFEAPTVEALAARLESLPGGVEEAGVLPLVPVSREGEPPLSFAQQRLWFIEQLEPGGFTYNVPYAVRLRGRLEVAALERSLGEIIRRHETLRTTFLLVDGRPVQHIAPELALTLGVEELEGQAAEAVTRRVEQEARRPFDLGTGPLVRVTLLRLAAEEHVLVLVVHHIACDLWSLNVLSRELETLYAAYCSGTEPTVPALPVQYADYAAWQREWLRSGVLEEQLAWWKQRLAGAPPVLELPADRPRPPVQTFRGAHLTVPLPAGLAGAVKELLSHEEGVTPFMAFLTGFQALLTRYSGQTDLVVGTPISGRHRREVEGLIGFFLNTLALRVDGSGDVSFRELLGRVRESCLGAYAHQDVPFEQLVDALQPARDLSRSPLFQVMFVYQTELTAMELPGVSVSELAFQPGMAKFDLTLFVRETPEGLVSLWEYNTDLYDETTVARMAAHYTRLLEGAVAEPERKLSALPLMDEAERRRVLVEFNDTRVLYAPANGVHELFEAWADRTPDAVAVSFGEERLTYGELNRKANRLAHHLRSQGVGPDVPVGLCVGRSMDLVVGVLGILKAGGAYVPLDPAYPAERLALMLGASRAPVVLTQRRLADTLPAHEAKRLYLDEEEDTWAGCAENNPEKVSGPESLAYVIYTSGSTGVPKGVAMHHRPLLNLIRWQVARSAEKPRTLQFSALSFDVSFQELFSTWGAGGELVLIPEELRLEARALLEMMDRGGVERLFLPFVALQNLAEEADRGGLAPRALKEVITAGEQLRVTPALRRLMKRLGGVLENQYGPTETHVATAYRLEGEPEKWPEVPSIGGPIANTSVHLLDEKGAPVPVGVVGELHIGGAAVARGYLHRPELTEERFIPDEYKAKPGARLYRTGDYARYLEDGNLEFLGRRDAQVKVRGFRIELAEVESALSRHPAVKDVVVAAREDGAGARKLVAYVVPTSPTSPTSPLPLGEGRGEGVTAPELKPEALRTWLKNRLPEYMVPSAYLCLESFPLTPSGKVDRRALPEPEAEGTGHEAYVAPRTRMEQSVAEIWAPLLGVRRVGAHDNFFELGGHSLLAMRVTSRLREALKVEVPVRVLFEAPTVAELARRLESLSEDHQETQLPPLVPVPREGALPLSFAQRRLWFFDRLHPQSVLYNLAMVLRLDGVLDVTSLERSFQELVHRHESLRTTFQQGEQGVVQVISASAALPLEVVDLRELAEGTREQEARRLATEEVLRPFELGRGPLLRVSLLRTGEAEHVLVLTMHHIVSDGWSMGVLAREVSALYESFREGRAPALEALPIQYADYAAWQQSWLRGEVLESKLAWWCEQLEGAPPALELPTDRPRPAVQSYRGALHYLHLPLALTEALRGLGQKEGVTLFMTLLAGFQALLHRYSGQEDISVGSPIAGRNRAELEGLIGFFINALVMRTKVRGEASFRELLHQVKEVALGAYAHEEVPFEKLVEALNPARDTSRAPLFQVAFALQNAPSPDLKLPGIESRPLELMGQAAKCELTLSLRETGAGLEGVVEYSTDLFEASTMARMFGHLRTLLEGVVADPGRRVGELPLLGEEERRQLLVEWNQTRTEYPRHATVHALFEEQAARRPEAVAVEYEEQRLTYAELNRRANQVARTLRGLGVGAGTLVGLCAGRSPELVAAMLGVLKAGGAYVPLDPSYPAERLAFMLEDAAVPVVLAAPEQASELPSGSAFVLELSWESFAHESGENLEETGGPESLAYVMYTSGSTGRPKGVCIPHRGIVRLVRGTDVFQVTAEDRFTQLANTSFDSSNLELWGALLNGARLVGVPREVVLAPKMLAAFLRERQVSVVVFTTPLFNQVAAQCPEAFQTVRYAMFGGEAADPARLREVLRRGGSAKLLNLYGPTENTTNTTWHEVKEVPEGAVSVPIGGPVANTEVYVLDERMQPVPVGVPGELYTGGDGLALGYLKRPELTEERFVSHPFHPEPGAKLYRTGDLVKYLPDGTLEFLGRRDGQVKVRGFRIELGEIDAVLARHPGVGESVVLARDDGPQGRWLVAYVVPAAPTSPLPLGEGRGEGATGPGLNPEALRAWLKQSLPEHMVPAAFVFMEALPLTPNGKVDRGALPAPDSQRAGFGASYAAPESGLERSLAAIWAEVLGLERVGVDDNFFDLGGNSLLLQSVHAKVEAVVGRALPMVELFQFSTVRTLAAQLAEKLGDGREPAAPERTSCLVRLQGGSPGPALFFPHAMGGRTFFYRELARRIAPHRPAYGFDAPGLEAGGLEPTTIEEMAAHYLELLRAVQPTGPYLLVGASFGGVLAYEMARRLSAEGHEVPLCALLDSPGPGLFPPPPEDDAVLLAGMVASWVELPAEALRGLPTETQLQKVLDEAARRGIEPPFPDIERGLRFLRVWRSHAEALHRYTAPRWERGALQFFRAAELQPGRPEHLERAWLDRCSAVRVEVVPGDHDSMLRPPHVDGLAARIRACLEQVHG